MGISGEFNLIRPLLSGFKKWNLSPIAAAKQNRQYSF